MTNKTAANRYARALLDVAVHEGADLQTIESQLAEFTQFITGNGALYKVLVNPAVPAPRKRAVIEALLAKSPVVTNLAKLLTLLAERDRLVLLPDLLDSYRERLLDHLKVVRAEVTTAVALRDDQAKAIEQSLAKATGRRVTLATRVDQSIIGGVVARVGSTVYDGSVTRQLEKMKQRLTESA